VIDIDDDPITRLSADRRDHGHAAGRHVDHLAWKFPPIREHIPAQQIDLNALKPAPLVTERA
jgi:hypothetical protein